MFTKVKLRKHSIKYYAYEILKSAGKPLHYLTITEKILKKRSIKGKTPDMSVNKVLSTDEIFQRVGRGAYGLREWKK